MNTKELWQSEFSEEFLQTGTQFILDGRSSNEWSQRDRILHQHRH
jgi:hypothetical protein